MKLTKYKTRALRTLSLLILVALVAALSPPLLTDSVTYAQDAGQPTLSLSASQANQVSVTWTEVTGASYHLLRWEETEKWRQVGGTHTATSYTDTAVTAGKTYYYQVTTDVSGRPLQDKPWSNQESVTVGAYDASTLDAPTASSTMMALSWSAVTGAASYELHRWETSEGWTQVGGTLTATSYNDTAVEIGKTYYYQVIAVGTAGRGAWSNQVSDTVPTTTPGAPINFSASPGDARASLSWDAPTSDGGSTITGYEYRYQMVGGSWSNWMDTTPAGARAATATGLTNGSAHNFEVRAENANGAGAVATASATPMSTVPGTPMGLGVTATGPTEITLSWTAVTGATGYQLQRRTNGGTFGSAMDAGSGTSYTDTGLTPSTTYDYEIRAVNAAGNSEWSGVVTSATTAPTAPDAVSDLDAMASADKITLTWTAPASNGADITGYDLDVSDDGSDWDDLMTLAATATSYDHMSLGPGTMKYYRISAMNSVGTSAWSASEMATVPAVAPGKPTLYASDSGTTIMLSWVAPAATGGADITSYRIERSADGSTGWGLIATKAGDDTSHDDTGRAAGSTWYYRINATNSAGTSDWSDVASATIGGATPPRGEAPDNSSPTPLSITPVNLDPTTATQGTSMASLVVSWLQPQTWPTDGDDTNNGDRTYEAEIWDPATQTWGTVQSLTDADPPVLQDAPIVLVTTAPNIGGTVTDNDLMGVTDYTYRIRAVDGTARGKWSAQITGKTAAVSPSQPMLTATKMGTGKVDLMWSVPDDGGSDVIGYVIRLGTTSGATNLTEFLNASGKAVAAAVLLDAPLQSLTHMRTSADASTDPNADLIAAGSTFFYQIVAVNSVVALADPLAANAGWSAWSSEATATTDTGVPGAPGVVITESGGDLTVTLTANTNTGGSPILSHEIQQYDAASDDWTIVQDNTTLTYTGETGVDANVKYYFRARSKNANGASAWTTESFTTPSGGPSAPKLTATVNGPNSITLSWTTPTNLGGGTLTGWTITMQTGAAVGGNVWSDVQPDTPGLGPAEGDPDARSATHTGLTAGTRYAYRIQAGGTGGGNQNSGFSNTVTVTTSTGGLPAAPAWDSSTPLVTAGTTVTLNWDEVVGATGYDIAMWENGMWVTVALEIASDPTDYVVSGLSSATTYYFSVRARNANGAGPWSVVDSIATEAGTPGKPVLTAMPDGATKIVLTWTAPDSGGSTITDYVVQVSNNGTTGWGPLDDAATANTNVSIGTPAAEATHVSTATGAPAPPLTVTHSGLNGMQRKFYRVAASTGAGTPADANIGTWSDVVNTTTPAGVPGMVVLAEAPSPELSDRFVISWTAPATGGSAITGYQVQIWDDGAWMDLMSVGGSATSYTHEGIPGAATRHYRVRAMNSVGYGPWSASQERTTVAGKPGAPVLHAEQNGSSEIRLTWTAPENGGTAITNYQIQVSNDGQSGWTSPETSTTIVDGERVTQVAADPQNYNHTGLDPATTRHYRVRAINGATLNDVGPWSNVAMASTLGGRPGRPALTAVASGTSIINLAWTPPTGDGGSAITGYEIEYWDGSNGWMNLTNPAATDTAYTHRNIGGGTTKFYRIRAMNSGGTGNWSTIAHATTATTVPAPPALVAMADGATKIKLTWTAGHDGGLAITKYNVQHSTGRNGPWAALGGDFTDMMDMSTEDTGLTGGTMKYYRIRATNSKGAGGWSPLAMATTDTDVPGRPTLSIGALDRALYVSWASPATPTGGSRIIRFELQIWDSANRRWVDEVSTTSTAYLDSGLTNGKQYFYRVRAVNAIGDGPWSTFKGQTPAASQ